MNTNAPDPFDLSVSEKLQLIEELWDSIMASPAEVVPIPGWQKEELARRKSRHDANPNAGVSWDEAKERIRRQ